MPIPEDEFLGTVPAVAGLQLLFRPTLESGENLAAEIQMEPDNFAINLSSTHLQIEQTFSPSAPLALVTEPKPLLGLASGMLTVKESLLANLLQITRGTEEMAQLLFAQFSLPVTN